MALILSGAVGCSSFRKAFSDAHKTPTEAEAETKEEKPKSENSSKSKSEPPPFSSELNDYERGYIDQIDRDWQRGRRERAKRVFSF